jgi:hypothetical protein
LVAPARSKQSMSKSCRSHVEIVNKKSIQPSPTISNHLQPKVSWI